MATTINYTTVRNPQRTTGVPRVCPACGGLECLCRPRFFAGQLLTEEDLNRLDHYIVAKQKLHNRYLHGWGVVCGLDVMCDACGEGSVIVRSGYALAPCGEDVIVCNDARVPVCDLISDCREVPDPDCLAPTIDRGCDEPVQQWILAICYNETPSRGVAPLKSSCGCGCGCGNSGGCGCGCGGGAGSSKSDCGCGCGGAKKNGNGSATKGCGCGSSQKGTVATTSASRGASLMQCENTIVCEGYCFRVYKATRNTDKRQQLGAMPQAFLDCITEFDDAMPTFAPTTTDEQELHDWCCDMHDAWSDWFLSHPSYNCELPQRIAAIPCPNAGDQDFDAAIDNAKSQFLLGALEIVISCFCTAIMPPCPESLTDDCVPLAVVTVRTDDGCRVQSICNWTTYRKYVTTFPSLQYWLSVFPFGRLLREAIESICCKPFAVRGFNRAFGRSTIDRNVDMDMEPGVAEQPRTRRATNARDTSPSSFFRPSAQTMARSRAFMSMAMGALTSDKRSANAEELVLGVLGEKNDQGEKYLSEMESENLMQYLVLDQMAKPTMRNLFGGQEGGAGDAMFRALGGMMGGMAAEGAPSTDAELGAQLDELRATVERQSQQIEELLRTRRGRNK
ncbi:MAG TPA: hypothetical protein VGQ56_01095 [Gemmatimonadaceae bacterium]|jgi:hypothetical protein|nr:hypothetical protein [Gemmatimonadaceae bacterium]